MHTPTLSLRALHANIEEIAYAKTHKSQDPIAGLFFNVFYTHSSLAGWFLRGLYSFDKSYKQKRYKEVLSNTLETLSHHLNLAKTCCLIARERLFDQNSEFVPTAGMEQMDQIMHLAPLCRKALKWDDILSDEISKSCDVICAYQETLSSTYFTSLYPPMDVLINAACGCCTEDQFNTLTAYFSKLQEVQGSIRPFLKSLYRWHQEWRCSEVIKKDLLEYTTFVQLLCQLAPSFFHQEDPCQRNFVLAIKRRKNVDVEGKTYQVEAYYDFMVELKESRFASYTIFHLFDCKNALFVPTSSAYSFLLLHPCNLSFADTSSFFPCTQILQQDSLGRWAFLERAFPILPHFIADSCPSSVENALIASVLSWIEAKQMPFPVPDALAIHSEQDFVISYPHLSLLEKCSLKKIEKFLFDKCEVDLSKTKKILFKLRTSSKEIDSAACCVFSIFRDKQLGKAPKITKEMRSCFFTQEAMECCTEFFQVLDEEICKSRQRLKKEEKESLWRQYLNFLQQYIEASGCSFYIPKTQLKLFAMQAFDKDKNR